MKRLNTILALGCIAVLSFTSCLKDDNDNENTGLSKSQKAQCFAVVRGEYTGKLIYPAQNTQNDNSDTIDINWSVGADTMLVLKSIPAQVVAEQIQNVDLKAALLEQNPVANISCYLGFAAMDPDVEFYIAPIKIQYPVFYKDETHTLNVYFWANSVYSIGYKVSTSGIMEGRLLMASAYLDSDESKNYFSSTFTGLENIPMIFSNVPVVKQ